MVEKRRGLSILFENVTFYGYRMDILDTEVSSKIPFLIIFTPICFLSQKTDKL